MKKLLLATTISALSSTASASAFVHLFEFTWDEVANECEAYLGPAGFDAVQISPPQEHHAESTWWSRYQPVNFSSLSSRSGGELEFSRMIERCHEAGVKIYADMVINHTADFGGSGVGSGGTPWSLMSHPGLDESHYHQPFCSISDYADPSDVQNCNLGALPDLDTSDEYVQGLLANYFVKLNTLGVDGYRIDAAKHMAPQDIEAILKQAKVDWAFMEVIANPIAPAALQPSSYEHLGPVTDFSLQYAFTQFLKSQGDFSVLPTPSTEDNATRISFVDNHDTERHATSKDYHGASRALYRQAQQLLLLAYDAYPKLLASYHFEDRDLGRPDGEVCSEQWDCWHRDAEIVESLESRALMQGDSVSEWKVSHGGHLLMFIRGDYLVFFNSSPAAIELSQEDKDLINRYGYKDIHSLSSHAVKVFSANL